jgi:hypothetical protein
MKPKVTVSRLAHVEHHGDWHDKPTKWQAVGPVRADGSTEVQKFATRAGAELYAKCRRNASSERDAHIAFANTALTGLLADPDTRPKGKEEACRDAVVRQAVDYGILLAKEYMSRSD